MRRSLTALTSGLVLVLTVGCGGPGDGGAQSGADPKPNAGSNLEAAVSIPGPVTTGALPPSALPTAPPAVTPQNFLPGEVLPPIDDDGPRVARTQQQIATLTQAVLGYIEKHKAAPVSLEAMAQPGEGRTPYFDPALLLDPWGSRIQYDAAGPRNGSKQPDIWSLGPTDGTVHIGNWSDRPTAAPVPQPMTTPTSIIPTPSPVTPLPGD